MGEEQKIQWHAAFCSAMELELRENREHLSYDREHMLNTKPLQIDMLVIKKPKDVQIANVLGRLFRQHNILEYKSPGDKLDEDVVLKVCAYACLYKVQEEKLGDIDLDEITITIVRDEHPVNLMKKLREHKFLITDPFPGIYYIEKEGLFPMQIIVSKELDGEEHEWLKALTRDAQKKDIQTFLNSAKSLQSRHERMLLDSVLQVAIQANQGKYLEVKEDVDKMSTAFEILFAKEINEFETEKEQLTEKLDQTTEKLDQTKEERDQAIAEADMLRKELERLKARQGQD